MTSQQDLLYKKKYLKYKQKYLRLQQLLQEGGVKNLSDYIENVSRTIDSVNLLLGNNITIPDKEGDITINIADYEKFKLHPIEYADLLFEKIKFLITYYNTIIVNLPDLKKKINNVFEKDGAQFKIDIQKIDEKELKKIFEDQIKYIMTQINTILPASISHKINNNLLDLIFNSDKSMEEKCLILNELHDAIGPVIFNTILNSQLSLDRTQRDNRLLEITPFIIGRKAEGCDAYSLLNNIYNKIGEKNSEEDERIKEELEQKLLDERQSLLLNLKDSLKKLYFINEKRKSSKYRHKIKEQLINLLNEFNRYVCIFNEEYIKGEELVLNEAELLSKFDKDSTYLHNEFNDLRQEITDYIKRINRLYELITTDTPSPRPSLVPSPRPSLVPSPRPSPSSSHRSSFTSLHSRSPVTNSSSDESPTSTRRSSLGVPQLNERGQSKSPLARLLKIAGISPQEAPENSTSKNKTKKEDWILTEEKEKEEEEEEEEELVRIASTSSAEAEEEEEALKKISRLHKLYTKINNE